MILRGDIAGWLYKTQPEQQAANASRHRSDHSIKAAAKPGPCSYDHLTTRLSFLTILGHRRAGGVCPSASAEDGGERGGGGGGWGGEVELTPPGM